MSFRRYIQIPKGPILVNYGTLIKTIATEQHPAFCRACLSDTDLRPLSNAVAATFSNLFKTRFVLEDTYPQFLCTICLGLLKKFHVFKKQCDRSQKVVEKLHLSGKLSKQTLKAEQEDSRFALNLSGVEKIDYTPSVKLMFTKTLCVNVTCARKANLNYESVPGRKKGKVTILKKPEHLCPPKIYNIVSESTGRTSQSLELIGGEDSLDEMCPTYNGIQLYTDEEMEQMKQQTRKKQMEVKKLNQMNRKRPNLVERDDSDTMTASSCDEYRQVLDAADKNEQIKTDKTDTLRHIESDHLYAKPRTFKSERLNQRMKSNKVNRNDQYIYSELKKTYMKTKLTLGQKKKHISPYKKCTKQKDIIVEKPNEKVELVNESDDETKPDIDSILLNYLKNQKSVNNSCVDIKLDNSCVDIKLDNSYEDIKLDNSYEDIKLDNSYEDIKPDVETLL